LVSGFPKEDEVAAGLGFPPVHAPKFFAGKTPALTMQ
jgi:hypothetical protein